MNELKINIDTLIKLKIGFEEYFVLYCLYLKNKELIVSYASGCNKISTDVFLKLESLNLIKIDKYKNDDKIYYELLSLTQIGQAALRPEFPNIEKGNFDEFRTFYPKRVKSGFATRPLHGNLKRCKSLYDKLLMETSHDILCKCAKAYHNEKIKSGSESYMQNLETWLNQKNYLDYLDLIENIQLTTNNTTDNLQSEDI